MLNAYLRSHIIKYNKIISIGRKYKWKCYTCIINLINVIEYIKTIYMPLLLLASHVSWLNDHDIAGVKHV